jgi:hypothetical protein
MRPLRRCASHREGSGGEGVERRCACAPSSRVTNAGAAMRAAASAMSVKLCGYFFSVTYLYLQLYI